MSKFFQELNIWFLQLYISFQTISKFFQELNISIVARKNLFIVALVANLARKPLFIVVNTFLIAIYSLNLAIITRFL